MRMFGVCGTGWIRREDIAARPGGRWRKRGRAQRRTRRTRRRNPHGPAPVAARSWRACLHGFDALDEAM
ncbi:unnamed protein product [Parnassius apollo]|uniref:(apollo) hypothetical protein n=1 Tax=Parnassius apollo TaxID=110799 RepID=A0A8S3X981_PARAO|nr:unnamed protein product [Parnassius apollo]